MSAIVEILKQNYKGKEVQSLSELIREEELGLLSLKELFDIVPGIKGKETVGYVGSLEKVTRKEVGCGQGATDISIPTRKVTWDPQPFKVHIKQCYKDWLNTWLEWALKNGIKKQDLLRDEYFLFLVDLIGGAIQKDFFRYALFGNKDHSVVGAGRGTEVLKAGENPEDFNIIDGLCAKLDTQIASHPERKFTIEANAKSSYAEQKKLGKDVAFKACEYLLDNADGRMFGTNASPYFLMTWSMAQNLKRYMREEYRNEMTFDRVENGFELSEFDGFKIVTSRYIDEILRRDFNNGTKWDRPHRIYLLDKHNNRIGLDAESSLTDIEVEYIGGDDEHNHIKASYMADFQRPYEEFGMAAF